MENIVSYFTNSIPTIMLKQITLLVVILFIESMLVDSRIVFEKLERQVDPLYAEITSKISEVNGESVLDIDGQSLFDGDDIMVHYFQIYYTIYK